MRPVVRVAALAAAVSASVAAVSIAGSAGAEVKGSELAAVRAATAKYHDVERAVADGYTRLGAPCFESEAGGMGIHYTNGGPDGSELDNEVEATQPDSLVYVETAHGLQLVAVEYIATGVGAEGLSVLAQPLHNLTGTPLYILHAWVWKNNPAGMFEDYNPKVGPCPPPPAPEE